MFPLEFQIVVDPQAPGVLPNAVTFETGASRKEVSDPNSWAYEHHGEGFSRVDPGALTSFFEDLILGRPLPLKFVTHGVKDVDTLVAMAAFTYRDVALHSRMFPFVARVDLVHRRGFSLLSHIESDEVRFLRLLRSYFSDNLTRRQEGERIQTALGWIREYVLEERLPSLGAPLPSVEVLTKGTNGFVVGSTTGTLPEGWVELYRKGYLRGVLFGPRIENRPTVIVARKSFYVVFDLSLAKQLLNEIEAISGGLPEWDISGDWLWGPPKGTMITANQIVEVLLRC